MPLAHEMRPGPVLQYTMDYLLLNIADLGCEGQWADWYEYMWNRTRAIRKVSCCNIRLLIFIHS